MEINPELLSESEIRHRKIATVVSLVVGIFLMTVKFWAHHLTDSQAIFSDAVESIVNVLAAIMAMWVIWYSVKPKDEDHPYGHGKSEYFSSAFEGGLITFASIMIMVEAAQAFIRGEAIQQIGVGLILTAAAGVANLLLGWFLVRRGKKLNSIALRASGTHVISDFWTSAGVIVGLAIVWLTGIQWVDSVVAFLVGLWLGWTGFKLVLESIGALMDQQDPDTLKALADVLTASLKPGIIQIHHVRVIRSGWYHHIDAHIVMPEFWDVLKVHTVIDQFENTVISKYSHSGEMNFHVDPCRKAYCQACNLKDCHIRREPFQQALPVLLEHLVSPVEPKEFRK